MSKSRVYKVNGRIFRYDYDKNRVEWVSKATQEELKDNEEWVAKYNHPLWEIEEGYVIHDTIGLSLENWKNKEARQEYLEGYCYDIDAEVAYLL